MKKSTILFICLIGLIYLIRPTLSEHCVEYISPLDKSKFKIVECPMITLDKRQNTPNQPATSDNMFVVNFDCLITDKSLCQKANDVFISAGKFITATLDLKQPINVNAKFLDLCQSTGGCTGGSVVLGAAGPAKLIPFKDQDGKTRLYPQALYKQLDLPKTSVQTGPDDIQAQFNSEMDYWFEGDPLPMPKTKVDMLYVVLHELVHGLGFTTAWDDYAGIQALTPLFGPTADATSQSPTGQFLEVVTDKFLISLPSGKRYTTITDQLNEFKFSLDMSDNQILSSFMASPQFKIAQDAYIEAMTPKTMGFAITNDLPNGQLTQDQIKNDVIIAETSLQPFQSSSSIAHVDLQTYLTSSDFLMMYTYPPGETLDNMMAGSNSTNTTGPIGPQLRKFLGMMGYQVKNTYNGNPVPESATVTPSNNGPDSSSSSSSSSDSSFVSSNLILSLVCVLITLIHNVYFKY